MEHGILGALTAKRGMRVSGELMASIRRALTVWLVKTWSELNTFVKTG